MHRALMAALSLSIALPAAAQDTAAVPATQMTAEQITAFNQAITDFAAGQKAQQAGDNAGALTKYEAALPGIRGGAQAQPDNMQMVTFLANALYTTAGVNAALGKMDAVIPLYEEALPNWRKVVQAKPEDVGSSMVLGSILTQLGNAKMTKQDKAGANVYYTEALTVERKLVAASPSAQTKNLLLSTLIGASQASDDPAIKTEVTSMSKSMLADGTVDAGNKPAAQILAGVPGK